MRPRARIYMYFVSYRRVRVRERESERARERHKNGTRLEGLGYGGAETGRAVRTSEHDEPVRM